MTDNSSLIPNQSTPNFAQQGQLDWVAVARTPVAFTLNVLARYGKAGVDALTVGVARAVCLEFDLKPAAQKRLEESISKLKTVPSFGRIAWFGFGLKHLIDDLLDTEQGAACVALSGCLTTSYDTDFASQVFRSICQIKGAPKSLTPSLRQWDALVRVCAGSLTNSQFPHLLFGFERLLATYLQDRCCRSPPESETLARAIIILGNLSKGSLNGATFSGGLDCAWIAAVAEWMLCLGVEINDSYGNTLYRSKYISSGGTAHVIINISGSSFRDFSDLTHKTLFIASGKDILRRNETELFNLRNAVRRSVPWTEILGATFGTETVLSLLHVPNNAFGAIIFTTLCLMNPNEPKNDAAEEFFRPPIGSQRDIELLEWTTWRLPELRACTRGSTLPSIHTADWEPYWERVEEACGCNGCSRKSPIIDTLISEEECCLKILALTIVDYLFLLLKLSIDPRILPSCNGLRLLYNRKSRDVRYNLHPFDTKRSLAYVMKRFALSEILEYLTGQGFSDDGNLESISALSANGICVFLNIFSDLDVDPLELSTIQVIPGYIEYEDSQCRLAFDIESPSHESRPSSLKFDENDFSYHMVVHQRIDETNIGVGYQMCIAGDGFRLIGLRSIVYNAMRSTTPFNCRAWCQEGRHETDKNMSGQKATISDKISINDGWVAVVLMRADTRPFVYTLEAIRCRYPRMYLDVLGNYPSSQVCLVRSNNCSKCLLMYAAETLIVSALRDDKFRHRNVRKPRCTLTIHRTGAEDVKVELHGQGLEPIGHFGRAPEEVGAVPLFPDVPLDHDPIDWKV